MIYFKDQFKIVEFIERTTGRPRILYRVQNLGKKVNFFSGFVLPMQHFWFNIMQNTYLLIKNGPFENH